MSLMNIAIIGGVVLLVLLLVKMQREKGAEKAPRSARSPKGGKGRGRGRRKDRNAPPAPPEPMPLAAAADAVSPIDEPQTPSWAEEPGQDEWPPAPAQEPAAWPNVTRLIASGRRNGVRPSSRAAAAMRWVTGAKSADA